MNGVDKSVNPQEGGNALKEIRRAGRRKSVFRTVFWVLDCSSDRESGGEREKHILFHMLS